jgi:hypothetical protein
MLWSERCDVSSARQHLRDNEQGLRTNPNSTIVRQSVKRIARAIDPDEVVLREVVALPAISGISRLGTPASRDAAFDSAVENFIARYYEQCDLIEQWQQKQRGNAVLSRQVVRQIVLRHAAESDDLQWINDIQWRMFLSQSQVLDAIEHLRDVGAVEVGNSYSAGDGDVIMNFRVTSRGRDLADGSTPAFSPSLTRPYNGPTINNYGPSAQQFGDKNVVNVADNFTVDRRSIHKVINEARSRLDDFPEAKREEVSDYIDALSEEIERPEPRLARLRTSVGNIGRVAGEAGLDLLTALAAGVVQGMSI